MERANRPEAALAAEGLDPLLSENKAYNRITRPEPKVNCCLQNEPNPEGTPSTMES